MRQAVRAHWHLRGAHHGDTPLMEALEEEVDANERSRTRRRQLAKLKASYLLVAGRTTDWSTGEGCGDMRTRRTLRLVGRAFGEAMAPRDRFYYQQCDVSVGGSSTLTRPPWKIVMLLGSDHLVRRWSLAEWIDRCGALCDNYRVYAEGLPSLPTEVLWRTTAWCWTQADSPNVIGCVRKADPQETCGMEVKLHDLWALMMPEGDLRRTQDATVSKARPCMHQDEAARMGDALTRAARVATESQAVSLLLSLNGCGMVSLKFGDRWAASDLVRLHFPAQALGFRFRRPLSVLTAYCIIASIDLLATSLRSMLRFHSKLFASDLQTSRVQIARFRAVLEDCDTDSHPSFADAMAFAYGCSLSPTTMQELRSVSKYVRGEKALVLSEQDDIAMCDFDPLRDPVTGSVGAPTKHAVAWCKRNSASLQQARALLCGTADAQLWPWL